MRNNSTRSFWRESFPNSKGTRWKVKGSPGGGGGLDYIGDNIEDYKRRYEIKTEDSPSAWKALIELCKTLNQTPLDRLEEALETDPRHRRGALVPGARQRPGQ